MCDPCCHRGAVEPAVHVVYTVQTASPICSAGSQPPPQLYEIIKGMGGGQELFIFYSETDFIKTVSPLFWVTVRPPAAWFSFVSNVLWAGVF